MNKRLIAAVLLVALSSLAFAGGHEPPPDKQIPTPVNANARAESSAKAGAWSGSKSSAAGGNAAAAGGRASSDATGGAGGSSRVNAPATASASNEGNTNNLGAMGNDNSTSNFRALALSLPSPVFTPPLPISGCPQANVEQRALSVGFGLVSAARGDVITDNCTTIIIYNNLLARCKWASADRVLSGLTVKVLPGYEAEKSYAVDLSEKQCQGWNTPVVAPPRETISFVSAIPEAPRTCVVAPKKIVKRKVSVCKP